jgi:hypothetical protein
MKIIRLCITNYLADKELEMSDIILLCFLWVLSHEHDSKIKAKWFLLMRNIRLGPSHSSSMRKIILNWNKQGLIPAHANMSFEE